MIKTNIFKNDQAKVLGCFQHSKKCECDKCDMWDTITSDTGYCSDLHSKLNGKKFRFEYIDEGTIIDVKKAVKEYEYMVENEICPFDKCLGKGCMGWVRFSKDEGFCVWDSKVTEKYTTTAVEGATNMLKIKGVWDASYAILTKLFEEAGGCIDNAYNIEERRYLFSMFMKDIMDEYDQGAFKYRREDREFYDMLDAYTERDNDGNIVDIKEDLFLFMDTVIVFGAAMNNFILVQSLAEGLKE